MLQMTLLNVSNMLLNIKSFFFGVAFGGFLKVF